MISNGGKTVLECCYCRVLFCVLLIVSWFVDPKARLLRTSSEEQFEIRNILSRLFSIRRFFALSASCQYQEQQK